MNTASENRYYVYAYLDPRFAGVYSYAGINQEFTHKPIYIGKGCGRRMYIHANHKSCNLHLQRTIDILKSQGLSPIILKIRDNLSEQEALDYEIACIKEIGKDVENKGPLCNFSDGGDSNSGIPAETRSRATKEMWQNPVIRAKLLKNCEAGGKAVWSDPETAEKLREGIREFQRSPEMREFHRDVAKRMWSDPEYRANVGVPHMKEMNEIGKEARLAGIKKKWQDEDFRKRQAEAVSLACSGKNCHRARPSQWLYNTKENVLYYADKGLVGHLAKHLHLKANSVFTWADRYSEDGNLHFGRRLEAKYWTSFPGSVSPSILLEDYQKPSRIVVWFYPEGSTTIERLDMVNPEPSRVHSSEWKWGDTEFGSLIRCVI